MDTDSMVQELMKAQNLKKTKIENQITTAEWKQDKWQALNAKIYSFYSDTLSKIRLQSSFGVKTASTSDANKVAVTASNDAPGGVHSLQISQLASA